MDMMIQAFNDLKTTLTNNSYLKLPDSNSEYEVTTNTSEDEATVDAVLTQYGHPITFESKKLNPHQ
jgi:hypothetical protein